MFAFLRAGWRILVAIKDALVLLFLLAFFGAIYALMTIDPTPQVGEGGALVLALDGIVVEQPSEIDPLAALTSSGPPLREYRTSDIIRALDSAITDARVEAVVLDLDRFLGGGQVSLIEIGRRIEKVKKAGKAVYAFATAYSDDSYLLAAQASEVWVDPMGGAIFAGPGGSNLYFRNALDRFGIEAHVYRVGTYKSAVEPFLRDSQSEEAKAASNALYGEIWKNWQAEVARARPRAKLAALLTRPAETAASAGGDLAEMAKGLGVVDRLGSRIDFGKMVAEKVGVDEEEIPGSFRSIGYDAWIAANPPTTSGSAIGILTVAGEIVDGEAGPGTAGGDTISDALYRALDEEGLKALVVRVNSPGGSALASEQIRRAVAEAKGRGLPVVVSMGDVAASGGYWVATAADAVFAEPSTITGSIGIFAVLPSFEKLLSNWGVSTDGVTTTPLSGQPDLLGGFNEEFDAVAQATIEHGYGLFLDRVGKARKMTREQVDEIGQGRVWAGGTARQIGLVDRLGGLDAALAEAARLAKLEPGQWHAKLLEPEPDFADQFFAALFTPAEETAGRDLFAHFRARQELALARAATTMSGLAESSSAQALCLDCGGATLSPPAARGGWREWLALMVGQSNR